MNEPYHLGELVRTDDGSLSLRHPEHGECYHSTHGALAEARSLYIEGSGFVDQLASGRQLAVLDVGLGLAYNAMTSLAAWAECTSANDLDLLSLEIVPALVEALASGEALWQSTWPEPWLAWCRALVADEACSYRATIVHPHTAAVCHWTIYVGDALQLNLVETGDWRFDFVWQDPFSPQKAPLLWSTQWFDLVRTRSRSGCVLMTYSVARVVREALADAGWQVLRIAAAGAAKKHWLKATLA